MSTTSKCPLALRAEECALRSVIIVNDLKIRKWHSQSTTPLSINIFFLDNAFNWERSVDKFVSEKNIDETTRMHITLQLWLVLVHLTRSRQSTGGWFRLPQCQPILLTLRGARWLEHRTGDGGVLGSNRACASLLRNFGMSVYPTLPVSLGGDTKSPVEYSTTLE